MKTTTKAKAKGKAERIDTRPAKRRRTLPDKSTIYERQSVPGTLVIRRAVEYVGSNPAAILLSFLVRWGQRQREAAEFASLEAPPQSVNDFIATMHTKQMIEEDGDDDRRVGGRKHRRAAKVLTSEHDGYPWQGTITDIAESTGLTPRQIRQAYLTLGKKLRAAMEKPDFKWKGNRWFSRIKIDGRKMQFALHPELHEILSDSGVYVEATTLRLLKGKIREAIVLSTLLYWQAKANGKLLRWNKDSLQMELNKAAQDPRPLWKTGYRLSNETGLSEDQISRALTTLERQKYLSRDSQRNRKIQRTEIKVHTTRFHDQLNVLLKRLQRLEGDDFIKYLIGKITRKRLQQRRRSTSKRDKSAVRTP